MFGKIAWRQGVWDGLRWCGRRLWGRSVKRRVLLFAGFFAFGGAILDAGRIYYVRGAMRLTAAAGAIVGGEGLVAGGKGEARRRAVRFIRRIVPTNDFLWGVQTTVEFPTPTSIRVRLRNPASPLNFAKYIGWRSVSLEVEANAELAHLTSVQPNSLVPLGVYCNRPAGCGGVFAVGQSWSMRMFCGDFFRAGPAGNSCGPPIADGESFLLGISFAEVSYEHEVRMNVHRSYPETVRLGQAARSWRNDAEGWQFGLLDRLAEGRNEFTLPVVRKREDAGAGGFNVEVADFMQVRVDGWEAAERAVQISFEIVRSAVSGRGFADASQGYGINSVVGVRLLK